MGTWIALLQHGVFAVVVTVAMREGPIVVVVLWSLKANEDGRKHALALLRLLRLRLPRDRGQEDADG